MFKRIELAKTTCLSGLLNEDFTSRL